MSIQLLSEEEQRAKWFRVYKLSFYLSMNGVFLIILAQAGRLFEFTLLPFTNAPGVATTLMIYMMLAPWLLLFTSIREYLKSVEVAEIINKRAWDDMPNTVPNADIVDNLSRIDSEEEEEREKEITANGVRRHALLYIGVAITAMYLADNLDLNLWTTIMDWIG